MKVRIMKAYFTITKRDRSEGYNISIGVGKRFRADNMQEIAYALEHYFQDGLLNKPFDYDKHIEHGKTGCDCCPLCRC